MKIIENRVGKRFLVLGDGEGTERTISVDQISSVLLEGGTTVTVDAGGLNIMAHVGTSCDDAREFYDRLLRDLWGV